MSYRLFRSVDNYEPSNDRDLATKVYVDGVAQGLDVKESVVAATTASFTMASTASSSTLVLANGEGGFDADADTFTLDGVSVAANSRVLIKDNVNSNGGGAHGKWNGIYTVGALNGATLTLTRADDADSAADLNAGMFTFVEKGTSNADSGWVCTNDAAITVGTTAVTFSQFSGAGSITAGDGLAKSGNTLSVRVDDSSIQIDSDILKVKASGVTNAMLAGSIADGKLQTISTAGKVDIGALEIDGATDIGADLADADLLIVDDGANGTERKCAMSRVRTYITGAANTFSGAITVGVDDTGYDVKLFGATSGAYMLWDESDDDLKLVGGAGLVQSGSGANTFTGMSTFSGDIAATGTVGIRGATTFGVDDTGVDVKMFGATSGAYLLWDESDDDLKLVGGAGLVQSGAGANTLTGATQLSNTLTVGVDDTGYDVKFFGATASAYMLWDESADDLILAGAAGLVVPVGQLTLGATAVSSDASELNLLDGASAGTVANSKAVIYGGSGEVNATTLQIGGTSIAATAAELNIMDGNTSASAITPAASDQIVYNDGGDMKQITVAVLGNYYRGGADTHGNLTSNRPALDGTQNVILVDSSSAAKTVDLPSALAAAEGWKIVIKNTQATCANDITITTQGSETIDGAASQIINTGYAAMTCVSDGSNWHII